jgi:heme exporter protein D
MDLNTPYLPYILAAYLMSLIVIVYNLVSAQRSMRVTRDRLRQLLRQRGISDQLRSGS